MSICNDSSYHNRFAVSSQSILQQFGEHRIPEGYCNMQLVYFVYDTGNLKVLPQIYLDLQYYDLGCVRLTLFRKRKIFWIFLENSEYHKVNKTCYLILEKSPCVLSFFRIFPTFLLPRSFISYKDKCNLNSTSTRITKLSTALTTDSTFIAEFQSIQENIRVYCEARPCSQLQTLYIPLTFFP